MKSFTFLAFSSLAVCLSSAQEAAPTKILATLGEIVRVDPALNSLIAPGQRIEVLASGFEWTEGPVWMPAADVPGGGLLLFSEIPSNTVRSWRQDKDGVEIFLQPSGYTGRGQYSAEPGSNGLALDAQGQLVSCEHGDRRISLLTKSGGKRTLADNYRGKRLNSPNDLTIKSNGDVYFTDPIYGLPQREKDPGRELEFCGVFRWSKKDGQVTLLTEELGRPNGLAFSPDEKTLYVAQSDPKVAIWMAFPVKEDGTLGKGKVLADVTEMGQKMKGLPDGMKVDAQGNLWATGPGGVHVMTPAGKLLGRLDTRQSTSNCAFGGPDGSILFITADMYVCRVQTLVKGK